MHEFSTAQRLLEVALKAAEDKKALKIIELDLEIGSLTHLNDEQLKFSFKVISEGTIAEGAKVKVNYTPINTECRKCGHEYSFQAVGLEELVGISCSECGSSNIDFKGGESCILKSIKVKN